MATITVPQVVPSPVEDAEALMKAFQGYNTIHIILISRCFGLSIYCSAYVCHKLAERELYSLCICFLENKCAQ